MNSLYGGMQTCVCVCACVCVNKFNNCIILYSNVQYTKWDLLFSYDNIYFSITCINIPEINV